MQLTEGEIAALRYYIGDVSGNDPFWGNGKAYLVLNALFYPGIVTERARAAEGKPLDPEILADEERLRTVCRDLLSVFRKSACDAPLTLFRVERLADCRLNVQAGHLISFTSTSTAGFLPGYRDRRGIALMRFRLPAGTPCIPMNKVLPVYAKAEEAEVLLPPLLHCRFEEIPLTEAERAITDVDGKGPAVSVLATAEGLAPVPEAAACVLYPDGNAAGQRVYRALCSGDEPDAADAELYSLWKRQFVLSVIAEARG